MLLQKDMFEEFNSNHKFYVTTRLAISFPIPDTVLMFSIFMKIQFSKSTAKYDMTLAYQMIIFSHFIDVSCRLVAIALYLITPTADNIFC